MGDSNWGGAYRTVADLIEGLTPNGVGVRRVETGDVDDATESLQVTLDIEVPLEPDSRLRIPATALDDAPGQESVVGSAVGGTEDDNTGSEAAGAPEGDSDGDPEYQCEEPDCPREFSTAAERGIHAEITHRQPEVAAYRNEAALEMAYEAFDSFPEMTEALGVDVTPQTVRRNAIEAGIHDPATPDDGEGSTETSSAEEATAVEGDTDTEATDDEAAATEGAADDDEASQRGRRVADGSGTTTATDAGQPEAPADEALGTPDEPEPVEDASVADPLGLPTDISVEDLRNVVVRARTLREAARELERSRDDARDLLGDLGLLELVHGRVTTQQGRAERADRFEEWVAARRERTDQEPTDSTEAA
jgi:hypothetical protein